MLLFVAGVATGIAAMMAYAMVAAWKEVKRQRRVNEWREWYERTQLDKRDVA